MSNRVPQALALALVAGMSVLAASTKFSDFTPLTGSAGPTATEATPITLSNAKWSQRTLADRTTQNTLTMNSNSGSWDMIASNATGPDAGRYLFMPFETGNAGVQRIDTQDPNYLTRTVTIVAPGTEGFVSGDPSRWAPWGGYLTGEESWGTGSTKGHLFEVTNPITAGQFGGTFVWRRNVPRVAHEGLAFDADNSLYFVDELNGGSLFKYVSASPNAATGDEFFAAGQSFALKVGSGGQFEGSNGPAITGAAAWVPITNATGGMLAGVTVMNLDGTVDGRASAHAVLATGYNRPEDIEIQTLRDGTQLLYFNTTDSDVDGIGSTGTSRTYNVNLSTTAVRLFASPETRDLATGAPVGGGFRNADNLAVDHEGTMYIVEDRNGGSDDDIWFARDLNQDGDLLDDGEGIGRWASNGSAGSEFTGLYFDLRNPNLAYVNIQHPGTSNDRTIEISAAPAFQKGNK